MSHPKNPGYIPGQNWCICDVCGFDFRAGQMRRRWDNLLVCPEDWEPRHPQDFVRGVRDDTRPAVVNPPGPDVFITTPVLPSDL